MKRSRLISILEKNSAAIEAAMAADNGRRRVIRIDAMRPYLIANALVMPASLAAAYALRDSGNLRLAFVALAGTPMLATFLAYFYYALKDPDRLHAIEIELRPVRPTNDKAA